MAIRSEGVKYLFTAGEGNTRSVFNRVRGQMTGLGNQLISVRGIVGTLTAALGVGAFAAGVKSAAQAGDAAAKMGDRFGIATEKLIGMQHAGELAGASNEGLGKGLRSMAKFASDAARGSIEQVKAMEQLNIKAGDFIRLPMDRQFSTIIQKLGEVENITLRNALGQEALGRGYSELAGLVIEGADAFVKAQRDAEAFGLAITRVDAAKLELANDAVTRAQAAMKGLFTTVALTVAPAVKALADAFSDSAVEAKGFKREAGSAAEVVIKGIGYAANVVQGLRLAYAALKFGVAEFIRVAAEGFAFLAEKAQTFGSVLRFIPGPLGLVGRMLNGVISSGRKEFALFAESAAENAAKIKAELESIALEGLPKDRIIAKVREIRALMEKEAVEIARRAKELAGTGAAVSEDKAPEAQKFKADTRRAAFAVKLERLREENLTELGLLSEKFREKNVLLQDALDYGLLTEEAAAQQSFLIAQKFELARTALEDEQIKKRFGISQVYRRLDLNSAGAFFAQMGTLMTSSSRTAFNLGKVAAISGAVIDTYKAATGAYAALASIPFVGPALGAAAAAAAIVAGLARVKQIKSTQFGGGGVAGGGASPVFSANPVTGVPDAPISPLSSSAASSRQQQDVQAQREPDIFIQVRGDDIFSGRAMAMFLDRLNEVRRDGGGRLVTVVS